MKPKLSASTTSNASSPASIIAASGEPVFILYASDSCAAGAIERYAELVEANHGDPRISAQARAMAGRFRTWPDRKMPQHPEPMPVAETPQPIEGIEFGDPEPEA